MNIPTIYEKSKWAGENTPVPKKIIEERLVASAPLPEPCNRKCSLKDRNLKNLDEIYEKVISRGFIGL